MSEKQMNASIDILHQEEPKKIEKFVHACDI